MTTRKKDKASRHSFPPCAVYGCAEPGEFKAPADPSSGSRYQFLCLEHVRKFNTAWDYFKGWRRDEIEAFMHSNVHGHRPTWSVNQRMGKNKPYTTEGLEEALARMMGQAPPPRPKKPESKAERMRREALHQLGLEPDADARMVKSQYKKLVKQYHPDVNDSKDAEEQFKRITEAYHQLAKTEQRHET